MVRDDRPVCIRAATGWCGVAHTEIVPGCPAEEEEHLPIPIPFTFTFTRRKAYSQSIAIDGNQSRSVAVIHAQSLSFALSRTQRRACSSTARMAVLIRSKNGCRLRASAFVGLGYGTMIRGSSYKSPANDSLISGKSAPNQRPISANQRLSAAISAPANGSFISSMPKISGRRTKREASLACAVAKASATPCQLE